MSLAWSARAACLVAVMASIGALPAAAPAALRLDAGFGEGGVGRVPFRLDGARTLMGALAPVRQPDGKVLVAAAASAGRFRVRNPDRCPDSGSAGALQAQWRAGPRRLAAAVA